MKTLQENTGGHELRVRASLERCYKQPHVQELTQNTPKTRRRLREMKAKSVGEGMFIAAHSGFTEPKLPKVKSVVTKEVDDDNSF